MMVQRPHHEIEELLGAYALDALNGEERDVVEAHLPTCPRCRAEVEQHREVAALLAHSGEAAPSGIWDGIAASLEETPPRLELDAVAFESPDELRRRRQHHRRPAWPVRVATSAVAVAASVLIAVLVVQVQRLNDQLDGIERERDDAVAALDVAERGYAAAVDAVDSVVVELVSEDGAVDARAVLAGDGTGYLRAVTLPRLPGDRTYQLWGVTEDERVISLGVFGADPEYEVFPAAGEYVAFAVTDEEAGGVPVSEQPAVAAGEVESA